MSDKKQREHEVLLCMTSLPQHMVRHHGIDNMPEFLRHNLCQQGCFNLSKAAYFVDNADFNQLKGVAGVARDEYYRANHWEKPEEFSDHMRRCLFNQKVRTISRESADIKNKRPDSLIREITEVLGFQDPAYVMWQIKYDNAGLLLFEVEKPEERDAFKDHLYNVLHLFGFCPIF